MNSPIPMVRFGASWRREMRRFPGGNGEITLAGVIDERGLRA